MFIGEAAALGLGVDIPILVRSLADCLSMTTSGPSLKYHESMRAILDNGLPADDPCALVPDYACAWWNDEAEPDADNILSFKNLARLLAVHGTDRSIADLPIQRPVPSHPPPPCTHCRQYRDLAADAVSELQGVLRYAQAMEVSAEAILDADTRRAQGFFLLHDGVQHKEMQEIGTATVSSPKPQHKGPTTIGTVNVSRKSQRVQATASAELERLQRLPTGSYKWTWGPQLTDAEAIALLAPAGEPVLPHSGYDTSLPSGGWTRYPESLVPSLPNETSNRVSSISSDHEIPLLTNSTSPSASRLAQEQESNHGANVAVVVAGREQQGCGVNTGAVPPNAETADASSKSGNESLVAQEEAGDGRGPGPKETTPDSGDTDSDIYVGDLVDGWGNLDVAEGVADAVESGRDLAPVAEKLDDAENRPTNEAEADSDDSLGEVGWGTLDNDGADSDDAVNDLPTEWGKLEDADDQRSNEGNAESDNSGADVASQWGNLDDADEEPPNDAETESDVSVGSVGVHWGDDAAGESANGAAPGAEDEPANDAEMDSDNSVGSVGLHWGDDAAGESANGASLRADPNPGPFTAHNFDYIDPSWLNPTSEPAPFDSDDAEYSDEVGSQADNSGDNEDEEGSEDQGSDGDDDGEAV